MFWYSCQNEGVSIWRNQALLYWHYWKIASTFSVSFSSEISLHYDWWEQDSNDEFDEEVLHMCQLLKTKLVDMNLSVRTLNCLKAADVETLGDLVQFNKTDLLKFRNFGKKSLSELDDFLERLNISFGTDISKYKLDRE